MEKEIVKKNSFLTSLEINNMEDIPSSIYSIAPCNQLQTLKMDDSRNKSTLMGHDHSVMSLIQLTNGKIASCSEDRSIKLRDLNTSQCINSLKGHTKAVRCLIQLNDNKIASCSFDKRIKIWDLKTNKNTVTLKGHESWVLALIKLNNDNIS